MAAIVGRLVLVLAAFALLAAAAGLARLGAADPAGMARPDVARAPDPRKDEARLVSETVEGAPVSLVLLVTADGVVVERPAGYGIRGDVPAEVEH